MNKTMNKKMLSFKDKDVKEIKIKMLREGIGEMQ